MHALLNYFIYICNFPLCRDREYLNRHAGDLRGNKCSMTILECNLTFVKRRRLQRITCSTEEEFYTLFLILFLSYHLHFTVVVAWEVTWFRLHELCGKRGLVFVRKEKKYYMGIILCLMSKWLPLHHLRIDKKVYLNICLF